MTNPTTTRPAAIVSLRDVLRTGAATAALGLAALFAAGGEQRLASVGSTQGAWDITDRSAPEHSQRG